MDNLEKKKKNGGQTGLGLNSPPEYTLTAEHTRTDTLIVDINKVRNTDKRVPHKVYRINLNAVLYTKWKDRKKYSLIFQKGKSKVFAFVYYL